MGCANTKEQNQIQESRRISQSTAMEESRTSRKNSAKFSIKNLKIDGNSYVNPSQLKIIQSSSVKDISSKYGTIVPVNFENDITESMNKGKKSNQMLSSNESWKEKYNNVDIKNRRVSDLDSIQDQLDRKRRRSSVYSQISKNINQQNIFNKYMNEIEKEKESQESNEDFLKEQDNVRQKKSHTYVEKHIQRQIQRNYKARAQTEIQSKNGNQQEQVQMQYQEETSKPKNFVRKGNKVYSFISKKKFMLGNFNFLNTSIFMKRTQCGSNLERGVIQKIKNYKQYQQTNILEENNY